MSKSKLFSTWLSADPINEINAKFLAPILKQIAFEKGEYIPSERLLEWFFGDEWRDVYFAKTSREFKMPGEYAIRGNVYVKGVGRRTVPKGKILIVRNDVREPFVTIGVQRDYLKKSRRGKYKVVPSEDNFRLTRPEFNTISDYIVRLSDV